jgi:hypothetical protein
MRNLMRGEVLKISNGMGTELRVRTGSFWITHQGDKQDHVVGAGASFRIERGGVTLVSALRPGSIEVCEPYGAYALQPSPAF